MEYVNKTCWLKKKKIKKHPHPYTRTRTRAHPRGSSFGSRSGLPSAAPSPDSTGEPTQLHAVSDNRPGACGSRGFQGPAPRRYWWAGASGLQNRGHEHLVTLWRTPDPTLPSSSLFSLSIHSYNRTSIWRHWLQSVGLEREIQQLRSALSRSTAYPRTLYWQWKILLQYFIERKQ